MLKKTLTYTDFNGQSNTEDFYFNLSKAELAEWEMRENLSGGLGAKLEAVIQSGDGRLIMDTFREIIAKSVGRRSTDGRSFIKTAEIEQEFLGSGAYEELFMELISSPNAAADFINGVVPQNLDQVAKDMAQRQKAARPTPKDHLPKGQPEVQTVTQDPADRYRMPVSPVEQAQQDRGAFDATPKGISDDYLGELLGSDRAMELSNDPLSRKTVMRLSDGQSFELRDDQVERLRAHYQERNAGYVSRPPHEGN